MSPIHYPNGLSGHLPAALKPGAPQGLVPLDDPLLHLLLMTEHSTPSDRPLKHPTLGSLAGYVYEDRYSLGLRSPHSPGVGGVWIILEGRTQDGRAVQASTCTGQDGGFVFANLPLGTYHLRHQSPAGFLKGWVTVGRINGRPDGTADGETAVRDIDLPAGGVGVEYNFGLVLPVRVTGRAPAGVRVVLTGINDSGQSVRREALAGDDGQYQFAELRPGIYELRPDGPAGWLLVGRVRGSFTGWPEEGNRVVGITLRSGDEGSGYDVQAEPGPR